MASPQQPAVWTVYTTTDGRILRFNASSPQLLNIGERWAKGRDLLAFFDENRRQVKVAMHLAAITGDTADLVARLRPLERKPFRVRVRIAPRPVLEGRELEWTVAPESTAEVTV
jgi:hypothetical protein